MMKLFAISLGTLLLVGCSRQTGLKIESIVDPETGIGVITSPNGLSQANILARSTGTVVRVTNPSIPGRYTKFNAPPGSQFELAWDSHDRLWVKIDSTMLVASVLGERATMHPPREDDWVDCPDVFASLKPKNVRNRI